MKFVILVASAGLWLGMNGEAMAQASRPKNVVGVPWGASRMETMRVLTQRGLKLPENDENLSRIQTAGGEFAGQPVAKWTFEFTEGKFSAAAIVIKPAENPTALYREFKQQFLSKYGQSQTEGKVGNPASKVKGNTVTWKFSPNVSEKELITITLELGDPEGRPVPEENQFHLIIRYVNETLRAAADKTPKAEGQLKPARPVKGEDL